MFGGFLVPGSSIRSVGLTARRFLGTSTPRFPRFKGDPPLPWENYEKNNFKNIHLYNKRHLKVHLFCNFKGYRDQSLHR